MKSIAGLLVHYVYLLFVGRQKMASMPSASSAAPSAAAAPAAAAAAEPAKGNDDDYSLDGYK